MRLPLSYKKTSTVAMAFLAVATAASLYSCSGTNANEWPDGGQAAKPGSRWWWQGSAVDSANLKSLIKQYADCGLGALEICPIYGVQGNEANDIDFLSDKWMKMYAFSRDEAQKNGIVLDMTTGTGWPFGGPSITPEYAAAKLSVETNKVSTSAGGTGIVWDVRLKDPKQQKFAKLTAVYAFDQDGKRVTLTDKVANDTLRWDAPAGEWQIFALWHGRTRQAVKRSAPGGEGFVMDYFNKKAVEHYLGRFDTAFSKAKMPFPKQMFSDSYEVYGADYTDNLFDAFAKQHGYRAEDYLPELLTSEVTETGRRVKADYCETIDSLLLNCFMKTWTDWLHANNSTSRAQAHGSVGNLLDLYAMSEVPECETYGRAKVRIRDLVVPDTFQRKNESDKAIMKFASSATHVMGKKLTSAESLTWATEHFRMTPAVCKPELDALFLAGINRIMYHGAAYSPAEAEWPGWKFYASVDFSPTNVFWPELKDFNKYVERCLTFMQAGEADADVLVYFPMFDVWYNMNRKYMPLSIENLQVVAPQFLKMIDEIEKDGFLTDYISDRQILNLTAQGGKIRTEGGVTYKAIVIPNTRFMHADVLEKLTKLAADGANVIFSNRIPDEEPGLATDAAKERMAKAVAALPKTDFSKTEKNGNVITTNSIQEALNGIAVKESITKTGLRYLRRKNADGYTYFIANLDPQDVDAKSVKLATDFADVAFYNPLTGKIGRPTINADKSIRIELESGETTIVRTFSTKHDELAAWEYRHAKDTQKQSVSIDNGWEISFKESTPAIDGTFTTDSLAWWTELPNEACKSNMGVAVYKSKFTLPKNATNISLRLNNLKETAHVVINGKEVGQIWCMPYVLDINSQDIKTDSENTLELIVKGTAANRIAQMDRDGIVWRKFKDTNMLDVKGKRRDYAWWPIEPMGLKGPVAFEFDTNE